MERVIIIDQEITGIPKPAFWRKYFEQSSNRRTSAFLVAHCEGELAGFIIGTVRAWEFGSPPAGWVHAVLVDAHYRKLGIGSLLLYEVMEFFKSLQVETVRSMMHIDDHSMISFFRFHGLSAGPYIELEMELDYDAILPEDRK